jgi:RsiW-degrading membrane proteinase PrsW (M82 family)
MSNDPSHQVASVLPHAIRNGMTVIVPLLSSTDCFKVYLSIVGVSLIATSSLLVFLSYTAIRQYWLRKHSSSSILERHNPHPQGYIWLVNLFVSGAYICVSTTLIDRLLSIFGSLPIFPWPRG